MYKCTTVVTHLYTYTGTEICKEIGKEIDAKIWRQRDRHKDTEAKREAIHLFAYCLKLVRFGLVGSVGSDFCPP